MHFINFIKVWPLDSVLIRICQLHLINMNRSRGPGPPPYVCRFIRGPESSPPRCTHAISTSRFKSHSSLSRCVSFVCFCRRQCGDIARARALLAIWDEPIYLDLIVCAMQMPDHAACCIRRNAKWDFFHGCVMFLFVRRAEAVARGDSGSSLVCHVPILPFFLPQIIFCLCVHSSFE